MVASNIPKQKPVYFDHHATTPVDPRVLEAMLPYFTEFFGNASSIDHQYGAAAARAVEIARHQTAGLIGAQADEIVFTSGATEADNLAILGVAAQYAERGNHIITAVTEHKAVLDPCDHLERQGWKITRLPVDSQGLVNPDDVRQAISAQTVLISLMAANNEIGVLTPLIEIGHIAREHEVLFHTDATQAIGHIAIDVELMQIDLLSLSAHKFYGPQGVGALYVRRKRPRRVRLAPRVFGGGHEHGMRSGTLNLPGIVGLGRAAEVAAHEMKDESCRLQELCALLWSRLQWGIDGLELNGHPTKRLPNNLNFAIARVENRSLLVKLKHDIAFSTGSACTTTKVEPSHVISALGFGEERSHQSVRFGLGRTNSEADVETAAEKMIDAVRSLRQISSL